MAERYTVYAGEPLATVLAGYDDNRSGRVNQICSEWLNMIELAMPELSEQEWLAIIDITNGVAISDDDTLRLLWAEVADSADECAKWESDQQALEGKLRGMPMASLYALRETVEQYWSIRHDCDTDRDALRRIGVINADAA